MKSNAPTPAEWRERLEGCLLPGEGTPPFELHGVSDAGYEGAAESAARAFLLLVDEQPELLDDPSGDTLWKAFTTRWPDGNDWLGGITGFQFGWAHNIVRYIHGRESVPNPAIVEIVERS